MKRLFLALCVAAILAESGLPAQAGPLFTYSALIDGVGSISILDSTAAAADPLSITAEPGPSGPVSASGHGADIRIGTSTGIFRTSFAGTLSPILDQQHTFTVTIHDLNNGLSGTFTVPFTVSPAYVESLASLSVPRPIFDPIRFLIGSDSFTISDPYWQFNADASATPATASGSPISGAFLVHVTGAAALPIVPEPSGVMLLGLGILGLLGYRHWGGRQGVGGG